MTSNPTAKDHSVESTLASSSGNPATEGSAGRQITDLDAMIAYGDQLADWINVAYPALVNLKDAYERRVRSQCETPEQLAAEPWRCAEFIAAEQAIEKKMVNAVVVPTSSPEPRGKEPPHCPSCNCGEHILGSPETKEEKHD